MLCMSDPDLIGTKRAAEILQCHGSTISRMVKEGRLACVRLSDAPASPMLFDRTVIEALAAELKVAS